MVLYICGASISNPVCRELLRVCRESRIYCSRTLCTKSGNPTNGSGWMTSNRFQETCDLKLYFFLALDEVTGRDDSPGIVEE
jgi:hypothetical protein